MKSARTSRVFNGRDHHGFSLVELLVVAGVISLLMSILLPVLGKARAQAKRAACRSQLHGVGMAMRMYVDDNDNRMPMAAQVPSEEPNLPSITEALLPYLKNAEAMHCPADRIMDDDVEKMADSKDYFEKEGTSYEYLHFLRDRPVDKSFLGRQWGETKTPVLFDFGPFHGRKGTPGAMNFLFGDGHIGVLEEE